VRQLESAGREFLSALAGAAPLLPGKDVLAFIDIDPMQRRVYGHAKAGAAVVSTPLGAPVIAATRLRGGSASSAQIVVRMDSAYYAAKVIAAIRRGRASFSVTARMDAKIRAAIAAIGEEAWTPIRYSEAIWDEDQRRWTSGAQVAEVPYTAFASRKGQAATARLIVRRVRDLNRKAAEGQDELFEC